MPVMFYSNDGLAKLIVLAWSNQRWQSTSDPTFSVPALRDALIDRDRRTLLPTPGAKDTARRLVNEMTGMNLKSVVIITEAEHDDDYTMQDPDEVVFVLPNETRPLTAGPYTVPPPADILETARMLMACTPNGI